MPICKECNMNVNVISNKDDCCFDCILRKDVIYIYFIKIWWEDFYCECYSSQELKYIAEFYNNFIKNAKYKTFMDYIHSKNTKTWYSQKKIHHADGDIYIDAV